MIAAGKKTTLLILQRATETRTASGEVTQAWSEIGRRWAHVKGLNGAEYFQGQQVRSNVTHTVFMGEDSLTRTLTAKDRLAFSENETRIMGIESIVDLDDRHFDLMLRCVERTT